MTAHDKHAFRKCFSRLAIALREKDPDVVMMQTYFDALQPYEIELVAAAAERLMSGSWFPKVGEWIAMLETIGRERHEKQRAMLRKRPTRLCAACNDTGWIVGDDKLARRCPCGEQRRLERLGRAVPPVALLASTNTPDDASPKRERRSAQQPMRGRVE